MLKILAKMLGVSERAAEDAIKSEKLAYATLTRRQALGGVAALVTAKAFGFVPTTEVVVMSDEEAMKVLFANTFVRMSSAQKGVWSVERAISAAVVWKEHVVEDDPHVIESALEGIP